MPCISNNYHLLNKFRLLEIKQAPAAFTKNDFSDMIFAMGFLALTIRLEAISKKGFWFKIAAAVRFKTEEYSSILRI
jgi:hypothetical protein